jgi:hypothetical protein
LLKALLCVVQPESASAKIAATSVRMTGPPKTKLFS